jgi:membrane peptidoglycan carboxypeptidase
MGGLTYGVTTMEMAAAYGAFVNRGTYIEPHLITRIESNDHKETVIDNTIPKSWPAMKETTAYLMNKLLRRVVTSGTGGDAAFSGMTIAGKTGTTTDNCDRYFAGYTPYYSAAVWMGYKDKPEKIFVKHGENPSAVVWKLVMEKLHEGLEDKGFFERPEGITSVTVCADCGLKATDLCRQDYRGDRTVSEEIQASAAPKAVDRVSLDIRSGEFLTILPHRGPGLHPPGVGGRLPGKRVLSGGHGHHPGHAGRTAVPGRAGVLHPGGGQRRPQDLPGEQGPLSPP